MIKKLSRKRFCVVSTTRIRITSINSSMLIMSRMSCLINAEQGRKKCDRYRQRNESLAKLSCSQCSLRLALFPDTTGSFLQATF